MFQEFIRTGRKSLTVRLLGVIILPLSALAILLGIGGAVVIRKSVETVNDRILAATSRAIADSLSLEDGQITLDLPPAMFGMLEDTERDNVYYNVRYGNQVLTGYSDLPDVFPRGLADLQEKFGNATYRGRDIRVIAEGRRLPGLAEPVIIEVAETMDARRLTEQQMLRYLAALEFTLIFLTLVLLPIALRWGMRPLARIRADMDQRVASDLHLLPEQDVPSEVRPLVRGFNDLLGRFGTLLEETRRFAADASHQMRTPLTILRTHIALLRKAPAGSADARDSLDDIDHASERLQRLLIQLLALSRAENAARSELELQPVDLDALVEEVASEHAPTAVAANIDVEFEPADGDSTAMSDPMLAREIIGNLVENAIRYSGDGGNVRVSIHTGAAEIVVAVEDEGPGIPPERREAAFSRFERLNTDANVLGSGLGLSIAQRLANAVRASISLTTPASGKGLRAETRFPRADRMMTATPA